MAPSSRAHEKSAGTSVFSFFLRTTVMASGPRWRRSLGSPDLVECYGQSHAGGGIAPQCSAPRWGTSRRGCLGAAGSLCLRHVVRENTHRRSRPCPHPHEQGPRRGNAHVGREAWLAAKEGPRGARRCSRARATPDATAWTGARSRGGGDARRNKRDRPLSDRLPFTVRYGLRAEAASLPSRSCCSSMSTPSVGGRHLRQEQFSKVQSGVDAGMASRSRRGTSARPRRCAPKAARSRSGNSAWAIAAGSSPKSSAAPVHAPSLKSSVQASKRAPRRQAASTQSATPRPPRLA